MNWWQLPGPIRFIERIVQDLRDGKNVVLYLPEWAPSGLSSAIHGLANMDGYPWYFLEATDDEEGWDQPINLLTLRFAQDIDAGKVWSIRTLIRSQSFGGKNIWIEGLQGQHWLVWRDFITQYAHACRDVPLFSRTPLMLVLVGRTTKHPVIEDLCLSHHWLKDYLDPLDMLLYVSSTFSSSRLTLLQRRTAIAVIAQLAMWDPTLADALSTERLERILDPTPLLEQVAQSRGWQKLKSVARQEAWCLGIEDTLDGERKFHSAYVSIHNRSHEIQKRIWSAQVGVIFPFIEEKRQRLLQDLRAYLTIPFETRFGIVDNLFDLELAHIETQIRAQHVPIDGHTLATIHKLKQIRNRLSHLETVTSDLLDL